MPEHRYQQYCALARTLDVAGDRWTLLIARELLPGPRRFTDLIDGLPGISRNLLTNRLRDLERDGIIARKELPPPVARQVYELTDEDTWTDIGSGKILFSSALATGAVTITGDPHAAKRMRKIFSRIHMLAHAEAATNDAREER